MFEFNPSLQWYDHGYWIRKWLAWPSWLPLPLHADHGLNLQGTLEDHENNCSTHIHLTWNLYRYSWLKHTCRKIVFLIPHPYLTMLARSRLKSCYHKCGTLVFWPHSTPDQVLDNSYTNSYLSELELLPDIQKPIIYAFIIMTIQIIGCLSA